MRAVVLSDTHELHHKMAPLPKADALLFCGDATGRGSMPAIASFAEWMGAQDYKHRIFIAGNHDRCFENENRSAIIDILRKNNITYLENSTTNIDGLVIYGSPITPFFFNWAFNRYRGSDIKRYWDAIPNDVDVLITHGPPAGILDIVPSFGGLYDHVGDEDLLGRVKQLPNLKCHCFGHLHSGYGTLEQDGVLYINAAICDEDYNPIHLPIEVELTKEKAFVYQRSTDYITPTEEVKQ